MAKWPTAMCRPQLEQRLALLFGNQPCLKLVNEEPKWKPDWRCCGLNDAANNADLGERGTRRIGLVD